MAKSNFTFSKDYLQSIANAGVYSYQQDQSVIQPDELLFGIFRFIKDQKFHAIFWQFFGLKDEAILESYITAVYHSWKEKQFKDVKFQLDTSFKKNFDEFSEMGITTLNVLSLLYMVFEKISDKLFGYLEQYGLDISLARKKILHVIKMTDQAGIPAINFFDMFFAMTQQLGIQNIDSDMIIDIEKMILVNADNGEVVLSNGKVVKDVEDDEDDEEDKKKKKKNDKEKLTIEYFGTDLTAEVVKGYIDPVIGRKEEILQLIYTLLRKTKNNPLLLGEAGVGKTAIVEGLAQKIIAGDVPEKLKGKRVFMLDIGGLIAGTKYRGEFEARLKAILEEAMDPQHNIILFIDEIHTIIGAGSAEGTSDAANMLKPMLARGKLQLIGATTFNEYQKYIEKDPALKRRFQEVIVNEPTRDDAISILQGIKTKFEEYHGVVIEDNAVTSAVDYSMRYIMNKFLPDKAIDLIDEAAARASTLHDKLVDNKEYEAVEKKADTIRKKIEKCITKQDYFAAAGLKEEEEALKQKLLHLRSVNSLPHHLRPTVDKESIGRVLGDKMGIPVTQITENEIKKLSSLADQFKSLIFGQDEAVDSVVKAIKRSRISVVVSTKPIASFLFLGPTGVGKTYLAKLIATEFFGDEKSMIRVDMSEYMERYSISKLIGSAPGYVGYEEGGALTEQVRRKPYSVILLDEIEKAAPEVLNVLLQILDEGHLKDNKGRWIDFKNTIIIMTSNIGSEYFSEKMSSLGFGLGTIEKKEEEHFDSIKTKVLEEVKEFLVPELINRLSAQIVFQPLNKILMGKIFKKEIDAFLTQWKTKMGLKLPLFSSKKIGEVIDKIYDAQYGARPIHRYIHDEVEPDLIEQVIKKELMS